MIRELSAYRSGAGGAGGREGASFLRFFLGEGLSAPCGSDLVSSSTSYRLVLSSYVGRIVYFLVCYHIYSYVYQVTSSVSIYPSG